jgi:hypothetical protein
MSDAELEAFEDAVADLGERVSEFLAEETDHTAEDIESEVDDLPMPDPLGDRAVDEWVPIVAAFVPSDATLPPPPRRSRSPRWSARTVRRRSRR